jgi:hypothetical protein
MEAYPPSKGGGKERLSANMQASLKNKKPNLSQSIEQQINAKKGVNHV